jgi:hypothetical protein
MKKHMKKQLLMVALTLISFAPFAQQKTFTMNTAFWKVKMGHATSFVDATETLITKFFPAKGGLSPATGYNITGGKHNGEYLFVNNIGKSFTDRDVATPPTIENIRWFDNWNLTVAPHVESITNDILVYKPEFSNLEVDPKAEKLVNTEWTVKNGSKAFNDLLLKMPKVWKKQGRKIAVYSSFTGETRYYIVRYFPNGWKDLDDEKDSDFATAWDEVYGKGSWDKDVLIFANAWSRTDRFMMTLNKRLTSK